MPVNFYDKASRFAATKLDAAGFLSWVLGVPASDFAFRGWLDTRNVPFPGDPDHTGDTVAHLENPAEHGVPWALAVEFQIQPDADMFGRLLGYLSALWLSRRPDPERGSRFRVGAAVINLTGGGSASREFRWPAVGLTTHLGVVERNLEAEPAADLVRDIGTGRWSRGLLPWVPLMAGADDPALIDRWKALADSEPSARRRSEISGLALLFAARVGRKAVWDSKLQGWNVETPSFVQEWIDLGEKRGEARGEAHGRAAAILRLGAKRFGAAPVETEAALRAVTDPTRLERILDRLLEATGWADLLETA